MLLITLISEEGGITREEDWGIDYSIILEQV